MIHEIIFTYFYPSNVIDMQIKNHINKNMYKNMYKKSCTKEFQDIRGYKIKVQVSTRINFNVSFLFGLFKFSGFSTIGKLCNWTFITFTTILKKFEEIDEKHKQNCHVVYKKWRIF